LILDCLNFIELVLNKREFEVM